MSRTSSERPPFPPALALFVAVLAISWAGPLVRYASAPALAIAMWRLVLSVAFIAGVLALRSGGLRWTSDRRGFLWAVLAGIFLAGHFWAWIASVRLTTVASSVVLVSTQPFFVALLSGVFLGERPSRREWIGIGIAFLGALAIGGGDLAVGGTAWIGDLLALFAALLVAAYYLIGRKLRANLDLWSYIFVVYGICALVLAVAVGLHPRVPALGYGAVDWAVFAALAAGPMMLGHTGVNYALRYVPAYLANLAILGEPVGATFLAWVLPGLRETPPATTLLGDVLILAGIGVATWRRRGRAPAGKGETPVAREP